MTKKIISSLSIDEFKELGQLAQLKAEENEIHTLNKEVSNILRFVEQLKQVNTEEVTPLFHPIPYAQRLRADEVTEENCLNELEQIASHFSDGLYWVPKVIEEK